MSGFMNIFNAFRSGEGKSATEQQPTATPTNPTVPDPATVGSDGKIAAFPETGKGDKSPLENYANLWTIDTTKDPTAGKQPTLSPVLNVEPTKIMEVARTLDFTKGLSSELLTKAAGGDGEALVQLINGAAQNAYAQGALATTSIVRNAFTQQEERFNSTVMPSILRRHNISNEVGKLSLSENPATAPMIQMLESQFSAKYPTASPSEIRQHAEQYLAGMAEEIVRGQGGTIQPKDSSSGDPFGIPARKEENWEKFFGIPDSGNMNS